MSSDFRQKSTTQSETEIDDDNHKIFSSPKNVHTEVDDVPTNDDTDKYMHTENSVDKPTYEIISVENEYKNHDMHNIVENTSIKTEKYDQEDNTNINISTDQQEHQININEIKEDKNDTPLTSNEDNYKDILYSIISSINKLDIPEKLAVKNDIFENDTTKESTNESINLETDDIESGQGKQIQNT